MTRKNKKQRLSVKNFDIFGTEPNLRFSSSEPVIKSRIGALCSVMCLFVVIAYASLEFNVMYQRLRT